MPSIIIHIRKIYMDNRDIVLETESASELSRISRAMLRHFVSTGALPAIRFGGKKGTLIFLRNDFQTFVRRYRSGEFKFGRKPWKVTT